MKITSFSPLILSVESDSVIQLFEDLGFRETHCNSDITESGVSDVTMEDYDGNRVDVAKVSQLSADKIIIRMNVNDFDEAYEMLISRGFKQHGDAVVLKSSKSALMVSPSGFAFDLCQHIK